MADEEKAAADAKAAEEARLAEEAQAAADAKAAEEARLAEEAQAAADAKATHQRRARIVRAAELDQANEPMPETETVPGGRYMVDGQMVDAHGNKVKG